LVVCSGYLTEWQGFRVFCSGPRVPVLPVAGHWSFQSFWVEILIAFFQDKIEKKTARGWRPSETCSVCGFSRFWSAETTRCELQTHISARLMAPLRAAGADPGVSSSIQSRPDCVGFRRSRASTPAPRRWRTWRRSSRMRAAPPRRRRRRPRTSKRNLSRATRLWRRRRKRPPLGSVRRRSCAGRCRLWRRRSRSCRHGGWLRLCLSVCPSVCPPAWQCPGRSP
jgi:hypothetical protein